MKIEIDLTAVLEQIKETVKEEFRLQNQHFENRLPALSDPELTVQEIAKKFNISKFTVYKKIRTGKLPFTKFGYSVRVKTSDLASFVAGKEFTIPKKKERIYTPKRKPDFIKKPKPKFRKGKLVK